MTIELNVTTKLEHRQLAKLAENLYPSLRQIDTVEEAGYLVVGENNSSVLTGMLDYWKCVCPEAGMPYWAIRSWTLLVWQPVYLGVIGVYGLGVLPALTSIHQKVTGGNVAGFFFSDDRLFHASEQELVFKAAKGLRGFCDELFEEFSGIVRLKYAIAIRLFADTLLSIISDLNTIRPAFNNKEIQRLARNWLVAADLKNQSALTPIRLRDGREVLALNRKSCCLHYLRGGGELCASCPKQKRPVRLKRLVEEYESNLSTEISR